MPVTNRTRAGAVVLSAALTLLFTGACGGGSDDVATSPGPAGNQQVAFAAYLDCLQRNGVTMVVPTGRPSGPPGTRPSGLPGTRPSGGPSTRPSGQPRPSGPPNLRPSGQPGGFGAFAKPAGVDDATWERAQQACESVRPTGEPGGAGNPAAFTAYRNCLNDHGVALRENRFDQLNTADPKVTEAMTACAVLRPTAPPTP